MKSAPCKDCEERHLNCHSECEKYISYAKERKEVNEKKRRAEQHDGFSPAVKSWYQKVQKMTKKQYYN